MSINIPSHHIKPLLRIGELSSDEVGELSDALSRASLTFSVNKIIDHVKKNIHLDIDNIEEIIELLVSMNLALQASFSDLSIEEFVDKLSESLKEEDDLPKNIDWIKLQTNLINLLNIDSSISVTGKALDVFTEHQRIYRSSRIFSDIRPVFHNNDTEIATTIVHTLKVEISDSQITSKPFSYFLTLDSNDLNDLKKVVDRAIYKEQKLKDILDNKKLNYLDTRDLDD